MKTCKISNNNKDLRQKWATIEERKGLLDSLLNISIYINDTFTMDFSVFIKTKFLPCREKLQCATQDLNTFFFHFNE